MTRTANPTKRATPGPCHQDSEDGRADRLSPSTKRQRLSRATVGASPECSNERLVHLNKVAIQCLQSGECDQAQRVLLQALDLIKARQLGQMLPQETEPGCTLEANNSGKKTSMQPPTNESPKGSSLVSCHDEGFRACMEPLHFGIMEHPTVQQAAIIYYNVGVSFLCFWKSTQALSWFKLALVCFDDTICPTEPQIMARLHANIGFCLKDDSPQKALKAYHLSLVMAYQSPELLNNSFLAHLFNAIGVLLFRMSQHSSALIYLQDSLRRYEALDGKDKEVATVTHNLGRVRFAQLDFGSSLKLFERSLTARRCNKDTSPVDLAASLCSVGSALEKLGREDEAAEFYAELIEMNCLEQNPVDCTLVCSALANIYKRQEKLDEARLLFEKALCVGRECLGERHPLIAGCLKALADCHLKKGDASKAVENYQAALKLERLASSETHLETVRVLWSIGALYQNLGHYTAAREKYSMVHELQTKLFGAKSNAAQQARVSMAEMEYRLKNYDEAFDIYQEVLSQKQAFGSVNESECSFLMNSLGMVCFSKGDFTLASKFFRSCLDIRTERTADSATVLYNLATAEEKRGCHERAIVCFEKSLEMDEAATSQSDRNGPFILDTLQRLGRMYQLSGDLHRALDCANRALIRLEGSNDSSSRIVEAKLHNLSGNLFLQLGDTANMMKSYRRALEVFQTLGDSESLVIAGFYLYGFSKLHPPCASVA